jgi:hypothetical protein
MHPSPYLPTRRRYLRGDAWSEPWYAWTLVACATAVSVALNVAHAPDGMAAQPFAALPPVALLGALELLMSVARTGLPHTSRTTAAEDRSATPAPKGEPDRHRSTEPSNAIGRLSGSATTLQIAGTLRHAGDVPPANEPYRTWAPTLVTSWLKEHSWRWRRDHPLDVAQGGGRRAADGRTRVGAPPATATAADRPATRMGGPDAAGCRQAPGTAGAARPRAGG